MNETMIELSDDVVAEIFPGHQYVGFYHGPGKRLYGGISIMDVKTLYNLIQKVEEAEISEEQLEIYYERR
jgi:hypothetical protein